MFDEHKDRKLLEHKTQQILDKNKEISNLKSKNKELLRTQTDLLAQREYYSSQLEGVLTIGTKVSTKYNGKRVTGSINAIKYGVEGCGKKLYDESEVEYE